MDTRELELDTTTDDGEMAVVGSMNHGASMWRLSDHERLYNWSHESGEFVELVAADFSPNGATAVTTIGG